MIQKVTEKRARQREEAARHVAGDYLTDERIAAQVGICRRTLSYWKRRPDFAARVDAVRAAYHAQITAEFMARAPGFAQNRHKSAPEMIARARGPAPPPGDVPLAALRRSGRGWSQG